MTEQHTPSAQAASGPAAVSNAAVGPLTIRDLAVLGSVAIIFVASLVPMVVTLAGSLNLWNLASLFYIGIGVVLPLSVGGLFLARRLSPETKVRIGSLSVDQFASVVASFATFFFFTGTVSNFGVAYLVGLVGSLLLLASTVCARWIPSLAADFAGRAEVPAHVVARNAVPALTRSAAPKPAPGVLDVPGVRAVHNGAGMPEAQATAGQGAQAHWATPQATASHTPAGQIFTPARENAPAVGTQGTTAALAAAAGVAAAGANSAPAAFAAQQSATQAATATGSAAANPVVTGPVAAASTPAVQQQAATAGNIAATSAINTTPAASQTAAAPVAANAGGNPAAAGAPAAVGLPQDGAAGEGMATSLNPQVAEPAKESAAPVPARESIAATVDPKPAVVAEPFWFAVDRPQNTIDERTRQFAFKLMPGAWILALEDRGNSFLVQDSHGKTGLLLDLVGIERASDSQ